jgi:hypothetical protein
MPPMDTGAMNVFIPVSDEILDHPELLYELVPYQVGMALARPASNDAPQSRCNTSTSPATTPSSVAAPALSSSTYRAGPALG